MDQDAKEKACRIAARHGVCLFTRGREVYGVRADGHETFVCRSQNPTIIWTRALQVLGLGYADLPPVVPMYRLQTRRATYESDWLVGLLLRLLFGLSVALVRDEPPGKVSHVRPSL